MPGRRVFSYSPSEKNVIRNLVILRMTKYIPVHQYSPNILEYQNLNAYD